jgi:hypothetical protein
MKIIRLVFFAFIPYFAFAQSLNNGLIAQYEFNTTPLKDLSGKGHDGQNVAVTLEKDRFGNANQAYAFNGLSSFVEIPNHADFQFGKKDFTLSLWLKYGSQEIGSNLDYSSIFVKAENPVNPFEGLTVFADYPSEGSISFRQEWNDILFTAPQNLNDLTWRHFVFQRSGNQLLIFINAQLVINSTVSILDVSNNAPIRLGVNHIFNDAQNYYGLMDDLRVYNRALSASEILMLFEYNSAPISTAYQLKLFPNPLTGSLLKIEASEKVKIETINLLDISGRRVWKQKFASTEASTLFSLTLPYLSKGSYLVEILVEGSKKAIFEKLIIQ